MNADQKEKLCLRLYLACFANPDDAPYPKTYSASHVSVGMTDQQSATVKITTRTIGSEVHDWARVDVEVSGRGFHLLGPVKVVEAALEVLPDDLKVQK